MAVQKRILGRTGWPVSVIGFGAIKLPRIGTKECERLLNGALDLGINFVDTADCYRDSAEKIGQALKKRRRLFYLSNPHITCAIPGMTSLEELEENVRVSKVSRDLSAEEIQKFMEKAGDAGKRFCRGSGYCLPCPEGVPIPDVFRYESYFLNYGLEAWAKAQYASLLTNAKACSECQQCLDRCPYGVPIPSGLKNAH